MSAKGQDNLQLYYGYGEKLGEVIRFQNERSNINLLYRVNGEKKICILGFLLITFVYARPSMLPSWRVATAFFAIVYLN